MIAAFELRLIMKGLRIGPIIGGNRGVLIGCTKSQSETICTNKNTAAVSIRYAIPMPGGRNRVENRLISARNIINSRGARVIIYG